MDISRESWFQITSGEGSNQNTMADQYPGGIYGGHLSKVLLKIHRGTSPVGCPGLLPPYCL